MAFTVTNLITVMKEVYFKSYITRCWQDKGRRKRRNHSKTYSVIT